MGKILVVDDEKSIRITLKAFLLKEGHEVSVAEDADEAMKLLNQADFDLVVTDIILPRITGVELLKNIRKSAPNVQVIMMTGEPTAETASEALRAGASDYLFKPISKDAIIRVVTNAMKIKQLNDEKQHLEEENRKHREELELLVEERTRALRESEKTAHVLLNSPPDGAMLMDINGRVLVMNERMAHSLQGQPDDFLGKTFEDLFPSDLAESREKKFQEVLKLKAPVVFKDKRNEKILDNRFYPVFDNQGNITRISIFSRDITEHVKLKDQIRQAQKMEAIGTLAGGIAHDFNNILFPILGYTEICMDELPPESNSRKYLKEVISGTLRAQELVSQILTFSRQSEQERKPVMIKMIFKEVLKLIRASLPSTIKIQQDLKSDGTVISDPVEIHQILMNLLTNSYHAMRATGGTLSVSLSDIVIEENTNLPNINLPPGNYIKLDVQDSGCGIDSSKIKRIFEPYFTTKEKGEGTGLGLATVFGIVKSLGGEITVKSEQGKGSTFNVYLPRLVKSSDESIIPVVKEIPGGSERLLLVDDEKQIEQMMKQLLKGLGYKVSSYIDVYEALDNFKASPHDFDLIITDFTMPGMTGIELNRKIREIRPEIPIILMTGYSERINEEQAKFAGIDEYIMKPILKRKMAETVRKALDKSNSDPSQYRRLS